LNSNFPFGLGFLLATFFLVFGTLFGRKKVALLNPFRAAKPTGKLPVLNNNEHDNEITRISQQHVTCPLLMDGPDVNREVLESINFPMWAGGSI